MPTVSLSTLEEEPAEETKTPPLPDVERVIDRLRDELEPKAALKKEKALVADLLSSGSKSLREAAESIGISKDKARRCVKRLRPHLRREFELD